MYEKTTFLGCVQPARRHGRLALILALPGSGGPTKVVFFVLLIIYLSTTSPSTGSSEELSDLPSSGLASLDSA